MGTFDFWSLITGAAGLLSFLLAAWDRFPAWRRYLVLGGVFLGGFALGRLSPPIGENVKTLVSTPQTAGSITILLVLAVVALVYFVFMLKKGEPVLAYLGLIFMFTIAAPAVFRSYSDVAFKISPSEYLMLSAGYEQRQDYDNSIRCLERYIESTQDNQEKELVRKKISHLKSLRILGPNPEKAGPGISP